MSDGRTIEHKLLPLKVQRKIRKRKKGSPEAEWMVRREGASPMCCWEMRDIGRRVCDLLVRALACRR